LVAWTLAPNVAAGLATVKATSYMTNLGTIGDTRHQAGAGDHTPWSTHRGKYGYPTQGQVHAQDIGMSNADLALFEKWIRLEWRAGRANGVKYINVLNRHWNLQTLAGWNAARAGTIVPRWSGDHHLHISYENGTIDGNLVARFKAYKANPGGAGPAPRPNYISGVKRVFDPNRVWPWKIQLEDGSIPFTNVAAVPAATLAQHLKFHAGFGGVGYEQQRELVEYIVHVVGASSYWWAGRLSASAKGASREWTTADSLVFKDLTEQAGGAWNPNNPVDTLRAIGHTDTWWK
jgi:hypothetical protein